MASIYHKHHMIAKSASEFNKYFDESVKNPSFKDKSVIIKSSNEKSNIKSLLQLFDRNQIKLQLCGKRRKEI